MSYGTVPIDAIERLRVFANWRVKSARPRQFLVIGAGDRLDSIASHLVDEVKAQDIPGLSVGQVWEATQTPGHSRSLRFQMTDRDAHHAVADVNLRRQGNDLFVQMESSARTGLAHLRRLLYGSALITLWCLVYAMFLGVTDTYESLVQEYAHTYHLKDPNLAAEMLISGSRIDETTGQWTVTGEPLSVLEIARRDPKLFLFKMAGPPTVIAGAIGALLFMIPRQIVFTPCRVLGWPTPPEFNATVASHLSWVESMLSYVLLQRFGIGQAQVVPSA